MIAVNELHAKWTVLPARTLQDVVQRFALFISGDVFRLPQFLYDFLLRHVDRNPVGLSGFDMAGRSAANCTEHTIRRDRYVVIFIKNGIKGRDGIRVKSFVWLIVCDASPDGVRER